jgi:hypothetical protein
MYGTKFIQRHGWYVNQAYFRFGIMPPRAFPYLEDVTPEDMAQDIGRILSARRAQAEAMSWFNEAAEYTRQRIADPSLPEPDFDPVETARRQAILREANTRLRRAERVLSKKIENLVREEFGYRKVGDAWVSETLLFKIVKQIFPDEKVIRHHRPDWLEGLELDIYFPDLALALEYQGQQHFHPVEIWGGEEALKTRQEHDARKKNICETRGVNLITVDYTEPLTETHLRSKLNKD